MVIIIHKKKKDQVEDKKHKREPANYRELKFFIRYGEDFQ